MAERSEKGKWIALEDPEKVFKAMIPTKLRIDESKIELPPASTLGDCFDGDDRRKAFGTTRAVPNRWICKLQIAYRDPKTKVVSYSEGSGLLIGRRHVLTAAHVVMNNICDSRDVFLRAIDAVAIVVIPGLDGRGRTATPAAADTMPFGWVRGADFRTNEVFRKVMRKDGSQFAQMDYAVIRLALPPRSKTLRAPDGKPVGYWGSPAQAGRTRIRALEPKKLRNVRVNAVGYPADKCLDQPASGPLSGAAAASCQPADHGSTPWYAFDRISSAGAAPAIFSKLTMNHDLAPGMSGGPVWLRWGNIRTLIGICHSCSVNEKDHRVIGSTAARITKRVKADIEAWIS